MLQLVPIASDGNGLHVCHQPSFMSHQPMNDWNWMEGIDDPKWWRGLQVITQNSLLHNTPKKNFPLIVGLLGNRIQWVVSVSWCKSVFMQHEKQKIRYTMHKKLCMSIISFVNCYELGFG